MVHEKPGNWKFTYTINDYQYRGKLIPISNYYKVANIVVLGDSHSFGFGVNDGEEYPAVMAEELKGKYNVINLSCGGWGLCQEVRRFYEFGILYKPRIVILQFSGNDVLDNILFNVTSLQGDRFIFHNKPTRYPRLKGFLSKSILQKSQVYNLVVQSYRTIRERKLLGKTANKKMDNRRKKEVPYAVRLYIKILDAFVADLNRRGIYIIMISANNHLAGFPIIMKRVKELSSTGMIKYCEVVDWLRNVRNYSSPEGHVWGRKAHRIIGRKLAEIIENNE